MTSESHFPGSREADLEHLRRAMELANDADVRVMAPETMVYPTQAGETATITRVVALDDSRPTDPRLPAGGSAIVRKYKGRTHRVVVLENGGGFEYEGERYRTLTAVAKMITGSHINGFRFFKLGVQR